MAAMEWIKCSERLPECDARYIVTVDTPLDKYETMHSRYVQECEFRKRLCEIRADWPDEPGWFISWYGGDDHPDYYDTWRITHVTHWMPLPEPLEE